MILSLPDLEAFSKSLPYISLASSIKVASGSATKAFRIALIETSKPALLPAPVIAAFLIFH
jgi:hypothetical protein